MVWGLKWLRTNSVWFLDDSTLNSAVRNLVMDHINSAILKRNYLSWMIQYDVQAAYLGNTPQTDLIWAVSRMSRWMDPWRPKKLIGKQKEAIKREKEFQYLHECRKRLHDEIRSEYGLIHRAKGQEVYDDYVADNRAICSSIQAWEWAVLKQVQDDYDATAPSRDIADQLNGSAEFSKHVSPIASTMKHGFCERSQKAEAFFCNKSAFESKDGQIRRLKVINDMISPCAPRERRVPRTSLKPKATLDPIVEQDTASSISKKRKLALDLLGNKENAPAHKVLQERAHRCGGFSTQVAALSMSFLYRKSRLTVEWTTPRILTKVFSPAARLSLSLEVGSAWRWAGLPSSCVHWSGTPKR